MPKKISVAVLGAGNMGTAIAQVVAKNGHPVKLWNYEGDPEPLAQIAAAQENKKYLAGITLSPNIHAEPNLEAAVQATQVVIFCVPSNFMAALIERAAQILPCGVVCVDASKGLDEKSLFLVPDIIAEKIPECLSKSVVSISGPAIARDMAEGKFTAMNVASKDAKSIKIVRKIFESASLKLVPTKDVIGVELAGSFKNVYAIAMGICDGLEYPMNTKAALLVMALKEVSILIKKMGGKSATVYDLAGLGDLAATGLCTISRNRRFGEFLAKGSNRDEAIAQVGQTVEGIGACRALKMLSEKHHVKMPFADFVYEVVLDDKNASEMLKKLLLSYK